MIGAGQSALEGAALLHEAGAKVQLLARQQARFGDPPPKPQTGPRRLLPQPDSPLGPTWKLYPFSHAAGMYRYLPQRSRLSLSKNVLGPLGGWWLADRVVGQFPVHDGHRVLEVREDGGKAVLILATADGRRSDLKVDHIVAATGYRVDLNRIAYISADLRARMRTVARIPASLTVVRVVCTRSLRRRHGGRGDLRAADALRLRDELRGAPADCFGEPKACTVTAFPDDHRELECLHPRHGTGRWRCALPRLSSSTQ